MLTANNVASADQACSAERPNALAWTSLSGKSPIDRINGEGPWARPDGQVIFATRAELSSGSLKDKINRTLDGGVASGLVWTGVNADGGPSPYDCDTWTSDGAGAQGLEGALGRQDATWTQDSVNVCSGTYPVICFDSD